MTRFKTSTTVPETARRGGALREGSRAVPEETPVAFTYGGSTHAVMMATPGDLEDFAVGFSLTEGIITDPGQIEAVEIVAETVADNLGIDLQIALRDEENDMLRRRRRHMAGPVGCGLCGIESIEQVETLMLLRGSERSRTVRDVSTMLRVPLATARRDLDTLAARGLLEVRVGTDVGVETEYVYRPKSEDLARYADLLAQYYVTARQGLFGFVATSSRLSIKQFSDAFKLRDPEP